MSIHARAALAAGLAAVLLGTLGCSNGTPLVKVQGRLVDGGQPVKADANRSMTVIFVPQRTDDEKGMTTYVGLLTEESNEFMLDGPEAQGIPAGSYRVKLLPSDATSSPRMRSISRRFADDQSPLLVEVQPGAEPLVIDLAQSKGR